MWPLSMVGRINPFLSLVSLFFLKSWNRYEGKNTANKWYYFAVSCIKSSYDVIMVIYISVCAYCPAWVSTMVQVCAHLFYIQCAWNDREGREPLIDDQEQLKGQWNLKITWITCTQWTSPIIWWYNFFVYFIMLFTCIWSYWFGDHKPGDFLECTRLCLQRLVLVHHLSQAVYMDYNWWRLKCCGRPKSQAEWDNVSIKAQTGLLSSTCVNQVWM